MAAHELLHLLVGAFHAGAAGQLLGAHGGLDWLAQHLPVLIELAIHHLCVRMNRLEATEQVVVRQHRIPQC